MWEVLRYHGCPKHNIMNHKIAVLHPYQGSEAQNKQASITRPLVPKMIDSITIIGRELGRVALPTVQRRLALSGKLCFNSLWPVSLAGNKCYRAGERITEPDCQGEEGRAGNNRQSKKQKKQKQNLFASPFIPASPIRL